VPDENAMKVQCGQCPAKYAVSDERIHDKKVRIHCKRCGASIVVDGKVDPPLVTSTPARPSARPGDSAAPIDGSGLSDHAPPSERQPRPVAHTIMGGLEAPADLAQQLRTAAREAQTARLETPGLPSVRRGLTDPPAGSDDSRWRVALTKQDLRWMTTAEIVEAYHAGAVKLETFVFRTGMPTWVTLLEVPEIAEALAEAGEDVGEHDSVPPKAPSTRPPPRKSAQQAELSDESFLDPLLNDEEEDEHGETVPFALVAERANAAPSQRGEPSDIVTSAAPSASHAPASAPELSFASEPAPVLEPDAVQAPPTFAAAQQASGGGGRWIWAVVVVVVLVGVAALVLPRLGVHLF
jgi:predicted Zn finger-like uncharacterized protein